MPSLTLIGLAIWIIVSLIAFMASGDIYYRLTNSWISIIPAFVFIIFYLALLLSRSYVIKKPKIITLTYLCAVNLHRFDKIRKAIIQIGRVSIIGIGLLFVYVITNLGIDPREAQQLRNAFYSQEGSAILGGSYFIWVHWFALSIGFAIMLSSIAIAVSERMVFTPTIKISVLVIILLTVMTGGRGTFLTAVLLGVGGWLSIAKYKQMKSKKIALKIAASAILSSLIIILLFINRAEGGDVEITRTFIKYFIGPIFALDQMIASGVDQEIRSALGRFGISFLGLDTMLVSGFARGVLGLNIESALASTSYYFHNGIHISNSEIMNAHYTGGARWFLEFGVIGYTLYYMMLATLCFLLDIKKRKKIIDGSKIGFAYPIAYALTFVSVVYSSREFVPDTPVYYMAGIWIYIIYRFSKRNTKKISGARIDAVDH